MEFESRVVCMGSAIVVDGMDWQRGWMDDDDVGFESREIDGLSGYCRC